MKARYPSYMKHSHVWKFILLGLLIVILVPFGLFAYGNVVASHYNGLDYPWHYPDTVWRSEEPRAEITVDGKGRTTLYLEVNGEMRLLELGQLGISVDIYSVSEGADGKTSRSLVLACNVDTASEDVLRLKIEKKRDDLYHGAYKYITFRRVAG